MAKPILERTAEAIFRADEAPKRAVWSKLPAEDKRRYETMAAGALSVALRMTFEEKNDYVLSATEDREPAAAVVPAAK